MSIATKRRIVTKQAETELILPDDTVSIVKVTAARGNNLHEVEDEKGNKYLVSMPTKFRKSVWIKRGQFLFIKPIEEGDKVKGEISHILDDENVLYIRENKLWPERFEAEAELLTRQSKHRPSSNRDRGHEVIDADMLPPSDTDESDEEGDINEDDDKGSEDNGNAQVVEATPSDNNEDGSFVDEGSDDDAPLMEIYNPNRAK
ncbi:hypothetical protein AB6A40_004997 [Gnathostoma spinigerum]|uniref:Probable RNA-binding protein EIF1AD n=1 Tax=Gnathostoma spinigerum TaxID=75299 RepID=A0ABD6EEA2_9BILA